LKLLQSLTMQARHNSNQPPTIINPRYQWLICFIIMIAIPAFATDPYGFTQPQDSSWGGWQRGSAGSVYAGWDIFESNPDPVNSNDSSPDGYVTYVVRQDSANATPEFTKFGVSPSSVYTGFPDAQIIAGAGLGIFKTSTNNWYSFSNTPEYNVVLLADEAHQNSNGPITVAFQIGTLGADIDDNEVELIGVNLAGTTTGALFSNLPFDSKTTLYIGMASDGQGGQIENGYREYLYLWTIDYPQTAYQIHIKALGSSMSLDTLAIDIGYELSSSPIEHNVPMLPTWAIAVLAISLIRLRKK